MRKKPPLKYRWAMKQMGCDGVCAIIYVNDDPCCVTYPSDIRDGKASWGLLGGWSHIILMERLVKTKAWRRMNEEIVHAFTVLL